MKLLWNTRIYGWRMTGLLGKFGKWFIGLSVVPKHYGRDRVPFDYSSVELKPCPFCGFKPRATDDDCIYPITQDKRLWSLNCYETAGGCGAEVLGDGPAEVIEMWNRRVGDESKDS